MVGIYWTFHPGWYVVIGIPLTIWILISVYRKNYRDPKEIQRQLAMGFTGLGLGLFTETIAVSMGLWHYGGGDWPAVLWLTYFLCSIAGYQIIKMLHDIIR